MRKLASIQTIAALTPIEGRDRIELATVCGWQVIVKKGEFAAGDLCVYCEIDSVLPEREEFEFLREKKFRIKTMKLGGTISQGICFPLSCLPRGRYKEGQDVTKKLGVTQFAPTMDAEDTGKRAASAKYPKWLTRFGWFARLVDGKGNKDHKKFPPFLDRTDETRIQNMPYILTDKRPWIATEKIDGQSGSFCVVRKKRFSEIRYEYIVCSRNYRLAKKDSSAYWAVSDRYNIEAALKAMLAETKFKWIAIQGECIASGVQGNKYKVSEPDMYVFNVITPKGRLDSLRAAEWVKRYGFKFVPILDTRFILPDTVEQTLEYAHGNSKIGATLREGIVFRSQDGKLSFKAVDPLFLLKYDE